MKLSSALLFLALGASAAEARAAGTRTARRAQDDADAAADDVAATPDDELVADHRNGGSPCCPCESEEVKGAIHFVVPEIPDIPEQQQCCGGLELMEPVTPTPPFEQPPIPSVGGIAIVTYPNQDVKIKSSNGSTFDPDACFTEKGKNGNPTSVLFCPVIPGQAFTVEVEQTYYDLTPCAGGPPGRRLPNEGPGGPIQVYLVLDDGCSTGDNITRDCGRYKVNWNRRGLGEDNQRELGGPDVLLSEYYDPGVSATFQCGSYSCYADHTGGPPRPFPGILQNTQYLDIDGPGGVIAVGPAGPGIGYSFDLATCGISPYGGSS